MQPRDEISALAPVGEVLVVGAETVLLTAWWNVRNITGGLAQGAIRVTLLRVSKEFGVTRSLRMGRVGPLNNPGERLGPEAALPSWTDPWAGTEVKPASVPAGQVAGGDPWKGGLAPATRMYLSGAALEDIQGAIFPVFMRWDVLVELMDLKGHVLAVARIEDAFLVSFTAGALVVEGGAAVDVLVLDGGGGVLDAKVLSVTRGRGRAW